MLKAIASPIATVAERIAGFAIFESPMKKQIIDGE
jgi:hypothetical protein